MSRGWHSTEGSDSQIPIDGQSAAANEAEGSSHNNNGAELAAEGHQKVGTPLCYFPLLNFSNLEKEIEEKEHGG
jgi:hypothetical protein